MGGELDLAQEALGAKDCTQLRPEYLERNRSAVFQVSGEIDRGMPPRPSSCSM
jgi:hypothetical protein